MSEESTDPLLNIVWSANTHRAYEKDWLDFRAWCADEDKDPLPADTGTVGNYLLELCSRRLKASTIRRRAVAIGQVHEAKGHENPTKHRYVEDIVRNVHTEQHYEPDQKTPVLPDDLQLMIESLEDDCEARVLRDRAILLVGWATGFRRSELASLTAGDVEWTEEGFIARLRRINRYQQTQPDVRRVVFSDDEELCPVRALRAWLDYACITGGPLFLRIDRWGNIWISSGLTGKSLSRIVKSAAAAAGFNPADYSTQSFRVSLDSE